MAVLHTPFYAMIITTVGASVFRSNTRFGPGRGPVFLSNVRCVGSEPDMLKCQHSVFVGSYCTHQRDVGVRCEGK